MLLQHLLSLPVPGSTPFPLHHSPRQHSVIQIFLNPSLIRMNSQGGESFSGFWALYFSFSQYLPTSETTEPL